jgi:hypothetical protein
MRHGKNIRHTVFSKLMSTPENHDNFFNDKKGKSKAVPLQALYRLHIHKQLAYPITDTGLLSIWKKVGDPILDMRLDYTTPAYHFSKIFNINTDWDFWRNKDPVFPEDALIWFTDGSRANSGTGSGIFGLRPNRSLSFPLGKFAIVFQTEVYAILQCACENIRRAYKNKRILFSLIARLHSRLLVARK